VSNVSVIPPRRRNCSRSARIETTSTREVTADGETQPDSFTRIHETAIELHERLEDFALAIERDPHARILHQHVDVGLRRHAAEGDRPAGRRELHRIREQVQQNLFDLRRVGQRHDRW
jgi:hypothetical protein